MNRRLFLVLWLLLALAAVAAPPQAGVSKLDAYFQTALPQWDVPGMAVAIVKDGKTVFARGYGVRESGKPEKVDADTLFAIASNSKAFTAAAVAALIEQGKLKWDDRVIDHLPYFQLYDPYVTADIRVRDLLCHRSGLGTFSGDLVWYGTSYSREEVVRRARFLKQAFPFRAGYGYQNLMFIAAGEVVARAAGKSWDDFVRDTFFMPLQMERTVTSVAALRERPNVATPHGTADGKLRAFPWEQWNAMAAAGGIISSASDMSKWLSLQLARGTLNGRKFFSEESSRAMWTPQVSLAVSKDTQERFPGSHFRGYGLGWSLGDYRGRLVVQHGGAYDGMYSAVAMVPEENLGIVVLTNGMTSLQSALVYQIIDAYIGGNARDWNADYLARDKKSTERKRQQHEKWLKDRVTGTQPSLPLDRYAGTYGGELYGNATISTENGKLVLRMEPNPTMVADLTHWHYDTFLMRWRKQFPWFEEGKAQFLMDNRGQVVEMKLDVPNEDFWFHELEFRKR